MKPTPSILDINPIVSRVWEFDKQSDFDEIVSVGDFVYSSLEQHTGRLVVPVPPTSGRGFHAWIPPLTVTLGKGGYAKASFTVNLSDVLNCDFGIGLGRAGGGWLGATGILSDGIVMKKDSGSYFLDMVIAANNVTAGYTVASTADYRQRIRRMGAGWAQWTIEIFMNDLVLGKGGAKFYSGTNSFHEWPTLRAPNQFSLCPVFGCVNKEAVAKTITFDRIAIEYGRFTSTSDSVSLASASSGGDGGSADGGLDGSGDSGHGCIPLDTMVQTMGGPVAFKDLEPGVMLHTENGPKRLEKTWAVGMKPLVKLTCANGLEFKCTPDQPVMEQGINEVKASDLNATEGRVDCLVLLDGICPVINVEETSEVVECGNLTVDGGIYFAGGVMVHNKVIGAGPTSLPGVVP